MSFCLKQSRHWEGGTEGGLEQYVRKTGGFLSLQGKTPACCWPSTEHLAAPGMHAFSPGRVAKGGRPTKTDGYLFLNYRKLLRNWPL